jgi:hypothetical protein
LHKSIDLEPDYTLSKYLCLARAHSNNIAHFVFSFPSDLVVFANFKNFKKYGRFFLHKSLSIGPDYTPYKYFCLTHAHSNNIAHFLFSFPSDLVVFANFKTLKNKVVFFLHCSIPFEPGYCIILEVTLETMSFERYLQKLIFSVRCSVACCAQFAHFDFFLWSFILWNARNSNIRKNSVENPPKFAIAYGLVIVRPPPEFDHATKTEHAKINLAQSNSFVTTVIGGFRSNPIGIAGC